MFRTDGEPLSGAERARVRGAVAANEPPDDPRLAQAAVSVARYGVSRRDNPVALTAMLLIIGALGGWLATTRPLWWFVVVGWVVFSGVLVRTKPIGGSTVDVLVWSAAGASAGSPAITRRAEVSG
jgi:hypothetical protein